MFFRHAFFALFGILKFDLAFGRKKKISLKSISLLFQGYLGLISGDSADLVYRAIFGGIALMADILPSYPPSLGPEPLSFLVSSLTDYCTPATCIRRQSSCEPRPSNVVPQSISSTSMASGTWSTDNIQPPLRQNCKWCGMAWKNHGWVGHPLSTKLIDGLVEVDDFVGGLWQLYKEVAKEGIVQVLPFGRLSLTPEIIFGSVPIRLYDPCGSHRNIPGSRDKTSRIQHHIIFLRRIVQCCHKAPSVLSLNLMSNVQVSSIHRCIRTQNPHQAIESTRQSCSA
jgi:hypothetical protein